VSEDQTAFPTLSDAQIELLDALGARRRVDKGDLLYRVGDPTYDFHVVLSGEVEIFAGSGADEQLITRHGAGRFLGELNMLTGLRVFVTARVAEPGEVLVVPAPQLRRIIATQPELSDLILAAFIARRSVLLTGAGSTIRVVGSRFNPATGRIREFLFRTRIPHEWLDPDRDADVEHLLREFALETDDLPVVIATGTLLRNPTVGELAEFLGITVANLPDRCFDLIVVGGGPAGLAASVYGASEGLSTLGVEALAVGGQAGSSSRIENYLGFPTGISGGDLAQRALIQAEKFGAALTSPCAATGLREEAGHLVVRLADGTDVVGRAVIVASGARYRRLAAIRLEEFEGNGVYYAATDAEARQCSQSPVVVVGGGNSAGQAALFLAESGSAVTVVIRRSDLNATMSRYLVDRIVGHPRIDVKANTNVIELGGDAVLERVVLSSPDGETEVVCGGLFSFIGADPASEWLCDCAALDERGFVLTDRALADDHLDGRWTTLGRAPLPFETSHPGLFAVGDVRSGSTKRVAAAVGEGSAAVRSVHDYLSFTHDTPVAP
jgi:thioredoxin reductase (NADPH)